ncbi:MAG: PAS domain-containing protein, partial [Pseudomonadota bacterium]|nr:PAS domain-containing protein [Pseudomonadota bacterium]
MSVQITPTHDAIERLTGRSEADDPLAAAIRGTRLAVIVTDRREPDDPIVFANDAFCALTGYPREEILGRNCRFLQGPDTDPAAVAKVRRAVAEGRDIAVEVLNYKKNGETFWNGLFISPVRNSAGEVIYFFGSQLDVTRKKQAELALLQAKGSLEQAVRERTSDLAQTVEQKTLLLHEVEHRVKNNLQL